MMVRMNEAVYTSSRRSQRIFRKMRVHVRGRSLAGRKFREVCESQVVSAHGGLLFLKNEVNQGDIIIVENPVTQDEQECRIVFIGEPGENGQRIGVEFLTPAPYFWGIDFNSASPAASSQADTSH
jgi:hypothetical protein